MNRIGIERALHVVAIGGGTGLAAPLRGLRDLLFPHATLGMTPPDRNRLTAVVTVADDGGSSGRLRRTFQVLPPGDIRNCLVALADGQSQLAGVFDFRFPGNEDVGGHSLGNLILTALAQRGVDFPTAVARAGDLLAIRGRVLPSTADNVMLVAEYDDGSTATGESKLARSGQRIRRVSLEPRRVQALPAAVRAIERAQLVVLGPGSLYTSIIPVLLVPAIAAALARSEAMVVLVLNLMTEPGETEGYSAADMLRALHRHAPDVPVHCALFNNTVLPQAVRERYAADGAHPVLTDDRALRALGCHPIGADLLAPGRLLRHDPHRLARVLIDLRAAWTSRPIKVAEAV